MRTGSSTGSAAPARLADSACPRLAAWAIRRCCCPSRRAAAAGSIGFMPHFESLQRGAWAEAAAAAGVTLIDPRGDPAAIHAAIGACRLLLSEAMHGVIVADAMRVPWIALRPLASVHHAKWHDWADTLDLRMRFQPLAASSLSEWLHASPLAASRPRPPPARHRAPSAAARGAAPIRRAGGAVPGRCRHDRAATFRPGRAGSLPHPYAGAAGRPATRSRGSSTASALHRRGNSAYHG